MKNIIILFFLIVVVKCGPESKEDSNPDDSTVEKPKKINNIPSIKTNTPSQIQSQVIDIRDTKKEKAEKILKKIKVIEQYYGKESYKNIIPNSVGTDQVSSIKLETLSDEKLKTIDTAITDFIEKKQQKQQNIENPQHTQNTEDSNDENLKKDFNTLLYHSKATNGVLNSVKRYMQQQSAKKILEVCASLDNVDKISFHDISNDFNLIKNGWTNLIIEYNNTYNNIFELHQKINKNEEKIFIDILKEFNLKDFKEVENLFLNELRSIYKKISKSIKDFKKFEDSLNSYQKSFTELLQHQKILNSVDIRKKVLQRISFYFSIDEKDIGLKNAIDNLLKYLRFAKGYDGNLKKLEFLKKDIKKIISDACTKDKTKKGEFYFNEIIRICKYEITGIQSSIDDYLSEYSEKIIPGTADTGWSVFFYITKENKLTSRSLKNIQSSFFNEYNNVKNITIEQEKILKKIYIFLKNMVITLVAKDSFLTNIRRIKIYLDTMHKMDKDSIKFAIDVYLNPKEKHILLTGHIGQKTNKWVNLFIFSDNSEGSLLDYDIYKTLILRDIKNYKKDDCTNLKVMADIFEKISFCFEYEKNIKNMIKAQEEKINKLFSFNGNIISSFNNEMNLSLLTDDQIANFGNTFFDKDKLKDLIKKYLKKCVIIKKEGTTITFQSTSESIEFSGQNSILFFLKQFKIKNLIDKEAIQLFSKKEDTDYIQIVSDLKFLYKGLQYCKNQLIIDTKDLDNSIITYIQNIEEGTKIRVKDIIQNIFKETVGDISEKQLKDLEKFYDINEYFIKKNDNTINIYHIKNILMKCIEYKQDLKKIVGILNNIVSTVISLEESQLEKFQQFIGNVKKYDYDKDSSFTKIMVNSSLNIIKGQLLDKYINKKNNLSFFMGKTRDKIFEILNLKEKSEIINIIDTLNTLEGLKSKKDLFNLQYSEINRLDVISQIFNI